MVFQSYALYPQMTVRGNLSFGLKNLRMPKAQIDERVNRAAEILQIGPLLDRKPGALSGGQRQRVAIGRALVRDVDVFLFDEPLSNLDAKLRSELRVEIKRLHTRLNNTMVYVTHDQIEALTLADRIAVMRGGIIQQLDAPQVIYNRPANLFVAGFIGSPSMNFLPGATVDGGRAFQFGAQRIDLAGYDGGAVLDRPKAILGLRPEHLDIRMDPESGRTIPAVVEIDEPMGADSLVWLASGDQEISVRVPVERRLKPGSEVHLHIDISKASIFDTTTEQRV
jgi:multiple sugar transport system ATP-binding protein